MIARLWRDIVTIVSELFVYPIKSARGIRIQQATLDRRGFEHDRRWMLVDSQRKFISQRTHPRLALVSTSIGEDLKLSAPRMEDLYLPLRPSAGAAREVEIWDDRCSAISMGPNASQWFSDFLGSDCDLVFMPDQSIRKVDHPGSEAIVGFADGFPLLLISNGSLEDLNRRLVHPVPMNRFRPNIVVSGCAPFAEDEWKEIRIGTVRLQTSKACERCAIPTVNQETGEQGIEPLKTLGGYRNRGQKILFGQNLIHRTEGTLRVGDQVNASIAGAP